MFRSKLYLFLAVLYCSTELGFSDETTDTVLIDLKAAKHPPVTPVVPDYPIVPEVPLVDKTAAVEKANSVSEKDETPMPLTVPSAIPSTTSVPSTTSEPTTTEAIPTTTEPITTPTPTPTPTPGPLPPPDQGTWHFTNKTTNVTCVVVQFAAQLNVTYMKINNKNETTLAHALLNVPANATISRGQCGENQQQLSISWPPKDGEFEKDNFLSLLYMRNETTKQYALRNLTIVLSSESLEDPASNDTIVLIHGQSWETPLNTSYRCDTPTKLNMTSYATSVVAVLTVSRLQEEAFRTKNDTGFSAARECGGGEGVPDVVPVAVGCALGGLVVVVLVAYLVGRRRSAARGYLSM